MTRTMMTTTAAAIAFCVALIAAVPAADAFSAFKSRFGGTHPICKLEPGTQIWPERDIAVNPSNASSAVSCPASARVVECNALDPAADRYSDLACDSVLEREKNCRAASAKANLGNQSDKSFWAGFAPYKYQQKRSWQSLGKLGTFEAPTDILVRVRTITEADPYYSFVYPAFRIGSIHVDAPDKKGNATGWGGWYRDPSAYWNHSWPDDCLCHNPHRYTRGPIEYVYGDVLTGGRALEPVKIPKGVHDVEGVWQCPNRGGDECRSQRVYQQRMRIEFVGCE